MRAEQGNIWIGIGIPVAIVVATVLAAGWVHAWVGVAVTTLMGGATLGLHAAQVRLRDVSTIHGRVHYGLTLGALSSTAMTLPQMDSPTLPYGVIAWCCFSGLATVSSIIGAVVYSQARPCYPAVGDEGAEWVTDLQSAIESLRRSFDDFHGTVSQERERLTKTWSQVYEQIEVQKARVVEVERELRVAQSQARAQEVLAGMTSEERRMLKRLVSGTIWNKVAVGVLAGLVVALLFEAALFLLDRMEWWSSIQGGAP